MRIAMVGTGYVGLVSGACFSEFGTEVVCLDKDAAQIERLEQGEIPIFEPGLDVLVANNREAGRLTFTTDLAGAVAEADAVFIAVGTPTGRTGGEADLSYVYDAVRTPRGKGKKTGSLHTVKPVELVTTLLDALRERNPELDPSQVDDLVMGTVEQPAEILRADRQHDRQADGAPQRIASADPVPEAEGALLADAEGGDLGQGGRHRAEMARHSGLAKRVDQPCPRGRGIGHGLDRGEGL